MRRRSMLPGIGLALCVLPWIAAMLPAQEGGPLDLSFLEAPEFIKSDAEPNSIERAQATNPSIAPSVPISPNTGMPVLEKLPDPGEPSSGIKKCYPLIELALMSSEYMDPRYIINSQQSNDPILRERIEAAYKEQIKRLFCKDLCNLYWSENTLFMGLAIAAAAPIANTHVDQGFRNWYQGQNGNSLRTNHVAQGVNDWGEYKYSIPALLAVSLGGHLFPDNEIASTFAQFGDRSLRAMAIGAPMVGVLQVGLGGQRPDDGSHWEPFRSSHGVSETAFVGAIPFLTAAYLTDYKPLQALLFVGSFATSWSRIQSDDQYLSQVLLGWTVAYLAVRSVNQTEEEEAHVHVVPLMIPNGVGLGVMVNY